jgi:hypothetical protein
MIVQSDHLGGRMPVEGRYGRIIAENGYCEHFAVLIDQLGSWSPIFHISGEK